jgi:ATP-binding cassette subfamily F protein 2
MVKRHNHLKIGWYHQHLAELLDLALTPLEYMFREFPEARGPAADRVGLG